MSDDSKHMIQIKTELYDDVKEFCDLNGIKIAAYINQTVHDGLMIAKYGDTPFTNYKVPEQPKIPEPIIINGILYDETKTKELLEDFINLQHKYDELEDECSQLYSELNAYKSKPVETNHEEEAPVTKPTPVRKTTKHRLK